MNAWMIPRHLTGVFSFQLLKWCGDISEKLSNHALKNSLGKFLFQITVTDFDRIRKKNFLN